MANLNSNIDSQDDFSGDEEFRDWLWGDIESLFDNFLTNQPIPRPPNHKANCMRWWADIATALAELTEKAKNIAEGKDPTFQYDMDEGGDEGDQDIITPEDLPR